MHLWFVTIGEPLPLPGHKHRLHRAGLLAQYLADRGHEITWWTSDFDHFTKSRLSVASDPLQVRDGLQLRFLRGRPYPANVSLRRVLNHRQVARDFRNRWSELAAPDLVLCSLPTLELCDASAAYASANRVPLVIDVRDLWPDAFLTVLPSSLRRVGYWAFTPFRRAAGRALKAADGIVGVSEAFLAWGLALTGRNRSPRDAVIPIGYAPLPPLAGDRRDPDRFLTDIGVDPSSVVVLFIGTFGRTYDLAPVLQAARRLGSSGRHDVQFLLCGAGDREGYWRGQASGLSNVLFTGWLDQRQIRWVLDRADIGVAAYGAEAPQSLPNKPFEYLAAGLPVLSSLRGEAKELFAASGCGLTYDARRPSSFFEALDSLLRDADTLSRMAGNALTTFNTRFSTDLIHQQFAEYLATIAHGTKRA